MEKEKEGNKALRYNTNKPKWSLVHFQSLLPMVRVLEFGATKYAPHNWQKGLVKSEVLDSLQHHLAALIDGEENDPESKESHMGHIMCNTMFYNYFEINGGWIGENTKSDGTSENLSAFLLVGKVF